MFDREIKINISLKKLSGNAVIKSKATPSSENDREWCSKSVSTLASAEDETLVLRLWPVLVKLQIRKEKLKSRSYGESEISTTHFKYVNTLITPCQLHLYRSGGLAQGHLIVCSLVKR